MPMAMIALIADGPEDSGDQDGDNQRRKGEDQVVAAHDEFVQHDCRDGRRRKAQRNANRHADADSHQCHGDRSARAYHDHRDDVAPELIGAKPDAPRSMVGSGWERSSAVMS